MKIEVEREVDGRWIADVIELPGVMSYGETSADAISKAKALALRVIADRIEHCEAVPELAEVFQVATRAIGLPQRREGRLRPSFELAGGSNARAVDSIES